MFYVRYRRFFSRNCQSIPIKISASEEEKNKHMLTLQESSHIWRLKITAAKSLANGGGKKSINSSIKTETLQYNI